MNKVLLMAVLVAETHSFLAINQQIAIHGPM